MKFLFRRTKRFTFENCISLDDPSKSLMTQGISGRRLPEHPAYIVISPATSVLRGDD